MSKEELLEMFKDNPSKVHLIKDKIPDGTSSTVYRCGPWSICAVACTFPIPDVSRHLKCSRIHRVTFWEMRRMRLSTYLRNFLPWNCHDEGIFEIPRGSRKARPSQSRQGSAVFLFHELSPVPVSSYRMVPRFTTSLSNSSVPSIVNAVSGSDHPEHVQCELVAHFGTLANYQENMFQLTVEKETHALKPMNCPGHCLMFKHRERSYRELPIRFADFGVLHRNELSALGGLTLCPSILPGWCSHLLSPWSNYRRDAGCLDFLKHVYGIFGFSFSLKLSTRPEKYLGELAVWWSRASTSSCLEEFRSTVGIEPRRWCLLRSQDWYYHHGCS